ncbi:MAG: NTP transferase domain-containing protein [Candidatus Hydrogenedentes bacterium]|nr:NTP transferase domain-containing protein [Candidatus Hydrogenedentota bacterium]
MNLIHGDGQIGLLYPEVSEEYLRPLQLIDADIAIVESPQDSDMPKIVWVEDGPATHFQNVVAYVGAQSSCPVLPPSAPYFAENQTLALQRQIEQHFAEAIAATPVYGLILTGGRSSRMGEDKGALEYHGRSQAEFCYDLLSSICDQTFLSLRSEQSADEPYARFPQILDTLLGYGPIGGIISALKAHPHAAWLVLACDLPYVSRGTIENLLANRNPYKLATAYTSANDGFPEPLCAVYEPKSLFRLINFLALGYHCPRKVLINSDTWLLELPDSTALDNANTPEERDRAMSAVASGSVPS